MALLLDGKKVAEEILKPVRKEIMRLKRKKIIPCLSIILVGKDDLQSLIYIKEKRKKAKELGIKTKLFKLRAGTGSEEIKKLIKKLNENSDIHGILVQLPLPSQIDADEILKVISPKKDVDGLSPHSPYPPACASGIMEILSFYKIPIQNKKVVIVGTGRVVGRPLSVLMKKGSADVVLCETKVKDFKKLTKSADILVGATSAKDIITVDMVKEGAVVIDAAKNVQEDVKKIASCLTPRIGGVGPVTVAMLLKNVVKAAGS